MANRKHRYGIPFQSIQQKVTAVFEIDEPLSEFGVEISTWPAQLRALRKNFHATANCVHRASRRVDVPQGKNSVGEFNARRGACAIRL